MSFCTAEKGKGDIGPVAMGMHARHAEAKEKEREESTGTGNPH